MNIDIISVIVFGLLVFIYTFTFSYNFLLVCHLLQSLEKNKVKNLFFSLLGGTLSLFVFCGLAGGIFLNSSKLKKPSPFFQSLFHIPVTGAELLIILDIIAGIILCLWLSKLCVVSLRHSLKQELLEFWEVVGLSLFLVSLMVLASVLSMNRMGKLAVMGVGLILFIILFLLKSLADNSEHAKNMYLSLSGPLVFGLLGIFLGILIA